MSAQRVRPRGRSANIFISYRREDSSGHTGRLFDALNVPFAGRLFMDIDTLEPGVDFVDAIEAAVGSCEVLIVVIGREWLAIRNAAGRRLDDPADFVRLEVESALARKIRVIPVLVQGAPMPRAEELPPSLARLARRNAIELSDARWAYDVDRLVRTIQDILAEKETAAPAPALPAERAAGAKATGSGAWQLSLTALVLVAAVVLAFVLWMRRTPSGRDDAAQLAQPARLASGNTTPAPKPVPETPPVKALPHNIEPARNPAQPPPVAKPIRKPPPVKSPAEAKPIESPAPPPAPAAQPPRATIASPAQGEKVGSSVQVQGTILDLGERLAFLCIRQNNGAIYPRGEVFPEPDGRFSIQLRSSKEKTFGVLIVTSAGKDATRLLRDQKSRDDGLPVLPAGASISSSVVTVKRQGKLGNIFNPQ
jgi:hypothetical protein